MNKVQVAGIGLLLTLLLIGCGGGSSDQPPPSIPPTLSAQLPPLTVNEGQSATFSVTATGTAPLSYQWQRNGTDIAGATSSSYTLTSTLVSDNAAAYTVVVTNSAGRTTSNAATLSIKGNSISQVIGSGGGTVTLTSNGVKATITFPPGALVSDTTITMQSSPPVGTELTHIDLQPTGVAFGKPVTIQMQLPTPLVVKPLDIVGLKIGSKKVFIPTQIDSTAQTITAHVLYFGLRNGVAPTRFIDDRSMAMSMSIDSARKYAQNEIPQVVSSIDIATLTVDQLAVLQPAQAALDQALVDMQATGDFEHAADLQLTLAMIAQADLVPELHLNAEDMLQQAATTVCAGLAHAISVAQATPVTNYGDFQNVAKPIVFWASASQALDAHACAGTQWLDTIDAKSREAVAFLSGNVRVAPPPSGYGPVATEIKSATSVGNEATLLNVPAAATDIRNLYVDPALTPIRAAAFTTSQTATDQSEYLTLIGAFGPVQSLSDDAQYAETSITVTSKDTSGTVVATQSLGRGMTVGSPVKTGTVRAKTDGSIDLTGSIAVLHCPNPAIERLQVLLEGIEVANIGSSSDMLLSNIVTLPTLSARTLLAAANISAANATQHRLEIKRLNSSCANSFAIADDVIATVTLDFTAAPLLSATFIGVGTGSGYNCVSGATNTFPAAGMPAITITRSSANSTDAIAMGAVGIFTGDLATNATWSWETHVGNPAVGSSFSEVTLISIQGNSGTFSDVVTMVNDATYGNCTQTLNYSLQRQP